MRASITVNGAVHIGEIGSHVLLVEYVRETLGLTGTKIGCETSVCGACTVLVDGLPTKSCTMLAIQADGSSVQTIEGLAATDRFAGISEAMQAEHGVQCGFCTPGVVASAVALLAANPYPSDQDILQALDGHLCRCTGYVGIVRAFRRAAATARGESPDAAAGISLETPLVVNRVTAGGVAGADVEVV